jgi:hypothetical protein
VTTLGALCARDQQADAKPRIKRKLVAIWMSRMVATTSSIQNTPAGAKPEDVDGYRLNLHVGSRANSYRAHLFIYVGVDVGVERRSSRISGLF